MFAHLTALNRDRHAATRVRPLTGFAHAARLHVAGVVAQEFPRAAALYPLVFLKDPASARFRPVALLGLTEGQNLFVDEAGRWKASYVPATIRQYPFNLALKEETPADFVVCVDEGSDCLGQEEGEPLFGSEGNPTPVLQGVVKYLTDLQQMDVQTQAFCQFLAERDLLVPLNMQLHSGSGVKNIQGSFAINESLLAALPHEQFIAMRERGYLPAVYAHLMSLTQIERLIQLAEDVQKPTQPQQDPAQNAASSPKATDKPARKGRSTRRAKA